jgi:hypothetical protein
MKTGILRRRHSREHTIVAFDQVDSQRSNTRCLRSTDAERNLALRVHLWILLPDHIRRSRLEVIGERSDRRRTLPLPLPGKKDRRQQASTTNCEDRVTHRRLQH